MLARLLRAAAFGLVCAAACSDRESPSEAPQGSVPIRVNVGELPLDALDALRAKPTGVVKRASRSGRTLTLHIARGASVALTAPGACPLTVDGAFDAGELELRPRIALSGPAGEVGYDAPFEITLRDLCPRGALASVRWETEGAELAAADTRDGGYRFVGRTVGAPVEFGRASPSQLVAVSAAQRAETRITARFTAADGSVAVSSVSVSAAPRSRGLPNVALGERILLGGRGYRVRERPPGSVADPMPWGALTSLIPDLGGRWVLIGPDSRETSLFVARYDSVALDCGRSDCHSTQARAAEGSPMTASLRRFFEEPLPSSSITCSFGCHTTGEPGRADGGFSHALAELGWHHAELPSFAELPRALRRAGGVNCLGCHGPGQIPEPSARWSILKSDVCAYCHDAPPRYGHVAAWRGSAMAESDRAPATRINAECARCHTTWGFLDAVGSGVEGRRMPPADAPAMGITCAACHAVHDESAVRPGLLRRVTLGQEFDDIPSSAVERSSTCIACHSQREGRGPSSVAIWTGRGVLDPETSAPLIGPAPHAAVPGGCIGCHRAGPSEVERGSGHAFRVDRGACKACHGDRAPTRLEERAHAILVRAGVGPRSGPPAHAELHQPQGPRERALALVQFVLEDRGAATHNPQYAEALLERAERILNQN